MSLLDGLEGGRWALATKTHHCLVDGVGSVDIGNALLDTSPERPPARPTPPRGNDEESGEHGSGRFWLSPGLLLRGARAGARGRAAPARIVRSGAGGRGADRPRGGDRGADSSLNGPIGGHPPLCHRAPGSRRRQGDADAPRRHGQRRRPRDLHGRAAPPAALPRRRAARAEPAGSGPGQHPHRGPRARARQRADVSVRRVADRRGGRRSALPAVVERAEQLKSGSQRAGGKTIVDAGRHGTATGRGTARSVDVRRTRMFNLTITNVPGIPAAAVRVRRAARRGAPARAALRRTHVGIAVVSYADQMVFGLNADRLGAPDVGVLAEGIRRSAAELHAASPAVRRRRRRRPAEAAPA